MAHVMSKKEFMALPKAQRAKAMQGAQKRARRPRKRANRNTNPVIPPSRNGQGRRAGKRRQRGGRSNQVTTFGNTKAFRIPIDEDIGTLVGSVGYAVGGPVGGGNGFALNPGNPALLPFASAIAQKYERYEFESLRFEYRPSVSMFATTGAQGLVGIAATMDALQSPPSTQSQADVMYHSAIVETARPTSLVIPKTFLQSKSLRERFFVRQTGLVPGGGDAHAYDCGQVFPWTNGQVNGNAIGTFRVLGSCLLSNPVSQSAASFQPNNSVALFSGVNQPVPATNVPFSVPIPVTQINTLGITVDATSSIFTLPAGNWNVDYAGDVDLNGSSATSNLVFSLCFRINGVNTSPFITSAVPGPNAANTVILHASVSACWFVQSAGTTTVEIRGSASYVVGVADVDSILRFTAV